MTSPILEVRDLRTYFHILDGVVKAVDGVDFEIPQGRPACPGRRVRLRQERDLAHDHAPDRDAARRDRRPARSLFDGRDILQLSREEMHKVRGGEIAMIFQEPMTSLNPVLTIGTRSPRRSFSTTR